MLKSVEHDVLAVRVRDALRDAILDGELEPGRRLIEAELAHKLDVSRATVREAIQSLSHMGIVQSVPRKGAFVSELGDEDTWEVYTLRSALEGLAFAIASERLDAAGYESLERIVDDMREAAAARDVGALSKLDIQFHRSVVEATQHQRLISMWIQMMAQVQISPARVLRERSDDGLSEVADMHQSLLDALRGPGPTELARVVEEHIRFPRVQGIDEP